jgi:uncharacterized membrane protein YoaK (UPF0700 family)
MIALAFGVGILALSHGYRDCHHSLLPTLIFTIGICFLFAKQIWHQWELYFLLPAVIAIIFAHYINYKLSKKHHKIKL